MFTYVRPLVSFDPARPQGALPVAGGAGWFRFVEVLSRQAAPRICPLEEAPADVVARISAPRPAIAGVDMSRPALMGILNVTPDSFSDGGRHDVPAMAVLHGRTMASQGAALIDIGGESTRPGALTVPMEAEVARTEPVITALSRQISAPISIDTRKAPVAAAALDAGAAVVNDVSGLTYDAGLAALCVQRQVPVCVMHAQGTPDVMQQQPEYEDVLLDVYDMLATQVEHLEQMGLPRSHVIVDPGIGFGKTLDHNLALLQRISLFHSLGCVILLGASRKRFIGSLSGVDAADQRIHGSVGVAVAAAAQGVQILRVHDVAQTRQALDLWLATVGQAQHSPEA